MKTPWISNEVLDLRRERFYHQRKARETRSQYHWQKYKKLRNHINRLERKLKSDYFCRMIEEIRNDSLRMWKCLQDALPKSLNHSNHLVSAVKSGKKILCLPVDVAEVFNKHFTTIGQKIAKAFGKGKKVTREHLRKRTNKSFHLRHITINFVKSQLLSLNTNKAIGLDKISARLLKDAAEIIAPSLQALINKSFHEGTGKDLHGIQTRNSNHYRLPKVKTNWGKQMSSYLFIDEWNKLNANVKLAAYFDIFKQTFWTSF